MSAQHTRVSLPTSAWRHPYPRLVLWENRMRAGPAGWEHRRVVSPNQDAFARVVSFLVLLLGDTFRWRSLQWSCPWAPSQRSSGKRARRSRSTLASSRRPTWRRCRPSWQPDRMDLACPLREGTSTLPPFLDAGRRSRARRRTARPTALLQQGQCDDRCRKPVAGLGARQGQDDQKDARRWVTCACCRPGLGTQSDRSRARGHPLHAARGVSASRGVHAGGHRTVVWHWPHLVRPAGAQLLGPRGRRTARRTSCATSNRPPLGGRARGGWWWLWLEAARGVQRLTGVRTSRPRPTQPTSGGAGSCEGFGHARSWASTHSSLQSSACSRR